MKDGRATFTASWKPPKLWDINTPRNQYAAELSLLDARGQAVDIATPLLERFGLAPNQDPAAGRWLDGLYLTRPTEWDDPYRFFGW